MDALLRRLMRAGVSRGLSGDHVAWYGLALAAFLFRRARRHSPSVVTTVPISAGDRLLVTLADPRSSGHAGA